MNDNDWISLQEQLLSNIEKIENNIAKNNITNDVERQILFRDGIIDVATSFHEQHKDVSLEDIKEISGFMLMLYDRRQSFPKEIFFWHIISEFPVIAKSCPNVNTAPSPTLILLSRPIFVLPLIISVPITSHIVLEYSKSCLPKP